MGGELTVTSTVGVGTTFRVSLPVAPEVEAEPIGVPVERVAASALRGQILVVDDEEAVLRIVKRVLAKDHEVTIACRPGRR